MAFPTVAARATGRTSTTDTTTHAITLPTGISAGDLLLVVFSVDQNPTITINTGVSGNNWNEGTPGTYGTTVRANYYWKIAEGSDALTLNTSSAQQSSHVSLRITGGYSVTGASANGSSTNSNPPSVTGPDGTQDYLWIATRSGDSTVVATAAPSSYSNLQTQAAAGTSGASTNTAERQLNGSSTDPGTFTSATEQWVAFTLCISPVTPVTKVNFSCASGSASQQYSDNFDALTPSAYLLGQGAWQNGLNNMAVWNVSGTNVVGPYTSSAYCAAIYNQALAADHAAQITTTTQFCTSDGRMGIGVRMTGNGATLCGYGFTISGAGNYSALVRITNGVATILGSTGSTNPGVGDIYQLKIVGSTLTVYKNGSAFTEVGSGGSYTDATYSSGMAGLLGYGSYNDASIDNFVATVEATSGGATCGCAIYAKPQGSIIGSTAGTGSTALAIRGKARATQNSAGSASDSLAIKGKAKPVTTATGSASDSLTIRARAKATASATGPASNSLTLNGKIRATGTATGSASDALTIRAKARATQNAAGIVLTGISIKGKGKPTGSSTGSSTGALTIKGKANPAGSASGIATDALIIKAKGKTAGASAGAANVTLVIKARINAAGQVFASAQTALAVKGPGSIEVQTTGQAQTSVAITGKFPSHGSTAGSTQAEAQIKATGVIEAASSQGTSDAAAQITGKQPTAAASAGTSNTQAQIIGRAAIEIKSDGTSQANSAIKGTGQITAKSDGTSQGQARGISKIQTRTEANGKTQAAASIKAKGTTSGAASANSQAKTIIDGRGTIQANSEGEAITEMAAKASGKATCEAHGHTTTQLNKLQAKGQIKTECQGRSEASTRISNKAPQQIAGTITAKATTGAQAKGRASIQTESTGTTRTELTLLSYAEITAETKASASASAHIRATASIIGIIGGTSEAAAQLISIIAPGEEIPETASELHPIIKLASEITGAISLNIEFTPLIISESDLNPETIRLANLADQAATKPAEMVKTAALQLIATPIMQSRITLTKNQITAIKQAENITIKGELTPRKTPRTTVNDTELLTAKLK